MESFNWLGELPGMTDVVLQLDRIISPCLDMAKVLWQPNDAMTNKN